MAKTTQFTKLISIRVSEELKEEIAMLKKMGVDIGTMLRDAANEKVKEIKTALDQRAG